MCDAEEDDQQKLEQVKEQERLAASKKRKDQEKRLLKDARKAEELEKKTKLDAIAAVEAAEAAAIAAVEQAKVDKKAAAAAEVEAQRLAKLAARKSKKNKTEDLDEESVLELAIAENDTVPSVKATASPVAASKLTESERDAQLLDALKAKKQLAVKSRRKVAKPPKEAPPSAEEVEKAAALASAAEIQRNRNIQKARDSYVQREKERVEAKNDKSKPQPTSTSPLKLGTVSSSDAEKMLSDLEFELVALKAEVADTSRLVVLDRVTELMIKLDGVPVASTELRARRKTAISRADALAESLRDAGS